MADNKRDLEFHLKTTGDTTGADKTEKALENVTEAAEKAAAPLPTEGLKESLDEITEAANKATDALEQTGNAGADATTTGGTSPGSPSTPASGESGAGKMGELTQAEIEGAEAAGRRNKELADQALKDVLAAKAAREHADALKQIEIAGKALVGLQTSEYLRNLVGDLADATGEGGDLREMLGGLHGTFVQAENSLGVLTAGLGSFVATGNPFVAAAAGIGAGLAGVTQEYRNMREAQKDLAVSQKELAEMPGRLAKAQAELGKQIGFEFRAEVYKKEADELERAERAMQRMNSLRAAKDNAGIRKADAEVTIARLEGGDVPMAETKSMMARFNAEVAGLQEGLAAAQAATQKHQDAADKARVSADAFLQTTNEFDPKYKDLEAKSEASLNRWEESIDVRNKAAEAYKGTLESIVVDYEARFKTMEAETSDVVTAETQKLRDSFYKSLQGMGKSVLEGLPTATGEVSPEVSQKISALTEALAGERQKTVDGIAAISVGNEISAAVAEASKRLESGIQKMGNAFIVGMNSCTSVTEDAIRMIENQQKWIDHFRHEMGRINRH